MFRFLQKFWPALLIASIWLVLFLPMITGQTVCGFRDSTQLYYPLFQFIDEIWQSGNLPLWNPYCDLGVPLIGDGTSSVFYPGKLIFLARWFPFPSRYGFYLAIHVLIAAAGAYTFARTMKASRAGATLTAVAYAFGGPLFFQLCNVIYLVSGAWLPLALTCIWKLVQTGRRRWAIAAGVCCAMMILGGDPQMVYHVGLIAVATTGGEFMRRRRRFLRNRNRRPAVGPYRWWLAANARLLLMVLVTTGIAAIQILPTWSWSQYGLRTTPPRPQNVYQVVQHLKKKADEATGTNGRFSLSRESESIFYDLAGTARQGISDHRYQFSLPPWSLAELAWPNVSGKPYPVHQRWTDRLPGSDRIWMPSLYLGLATILLAIGAVTLRKPKRRARWLTLLILFFGVASFGWYGLFWLIRETMLSINPESLNVENGNQPFVTMFGPQVGGLYWAMTLLLPKYYAFRYPAKLFIICSLGIATLAGVSLRRGRIRIPSLPAQIIFVLSIAGIIIAWSGWAYLRMSEISGNELFGPFQIEQTRIELTKTFCQTLAVIALLVLLARLQSRPGWRRLAVVGIVLLTSLEIVVANRWMKLEVDANVMAMDQTDESLIRAIEKANSDDTSDDALPLYILENSGFPPPDEWTTQSSPDRMQQIVRWQLDTLQPKSHLRHRLIHLNSFHSIEPVDYNSYAIHDHYRHLSLFSVVHTDTAGGTKTSLVPTTPQHVGSFLPSLTNDAPPDQRSSNLLVPADNINLKVTSFEPGRIQADLKFLDSRRFVPLRMMILPDWQIKACPIIDGKPTGAAIRCEFDVPEHGLRLADLKAGIRLPGDHDHWQLSLTYDPPLFRIGAWISAGSIALLIPVCAAFRFRGPNVRPETTRPLSEPRSPATDGE